MIDLSEFVFLSDTTLATDSRRVAKHFKKAHKSVLRAYDNLTCSEEFNRLNFAPVEEVDGKGELRRVIRMTKNGFVMLAMGFTGAEATKFKEKFIGAFDAMAEQLQKIGDSRWERRLDLEKRDATSFMWASFGGQCMAKRRHEKPLLDNERALLEAEMQPSLLLDSQ